MGKSYLERAGEGRKALIYTRPEKCDFCDNAKALLQEKGITYEERNVRDHMQLAKEKGWTTVPQIYLDGEYVGGFNQLKVLLP